MERLSRRTLLLAGSSASCVRREPRDGRRHLRFVAWGDGTEWAVFQRLAKQFELIHQDVAIDLERVSFRFQEQLDTRIAAGVGPDLFRVQFMDIGRYTPSNALIDLSPYLPPGLSEEFEPAVWQSVLYKGRPHAIPHHTDTSALIFNQDRLKKAGIKPPDRLDDSWTWEEFTSISRSLKKQGGADYAFAMNWTHQGAYRWLSFLHQRGGRLIAPDNKTPAIPSTEALDTLRWTASWFREGLSPRTAVPKSGVDVENLFLTGVVGMIFSSTIDPFRIRKLAFEWGATFQPRDRAFASDLGGNAIGVSRDCRYPELASEFVLFLTNKANMKSFVTDAQFLPVRRELATENLSYRFRPDAMRVLAEQAKTVPADLARTVTQPGFHRIHRRLADELSGCLGGDESPEQALANIAREVNRVSALS